ncbi:MAG: hypothetical protein IPG09_03600 [Ignavibacteria bacterium]|nr:hypothetical protein [Ignavibacteria bacterium]
MLLERILRFPPDCPLEVVLITTFKTNLENTYPDVTFFTIDDLISFKPNKYNEVWDLFREIILKNV